MKIRYILVFLITIFCNLCFAQNVEVGSFGTTGASWNTNNTILQIKRDANTVFQTNILVLRSNLPGITSRPLKAEARVIFINKLDGDWAIVSPVLEFTNSDFNSSSGASNVKSVTTTIPKDFLYSPAKGELTVQWRYYKDGYPYPDNV